MTVAHIYENRVRDVIEAGEMPEWGPYPDGRIPLLVDVTGQGAKLGDGWNPVANALVSRPDGKEREGYIVRWDDENYVFIVEGEFEKRVRDKENEIQRVKNQLADIDRETMAGRPVREILNRYIEEEDISGEAAEILKEAETRAAELRERLEKLEGEMAALSGGT